VLNSSQVSRIEKKIHAYTAVVIFNGVTTVGNAMNGVDLRHNWIQKDN
jgi:hypothetical protein